ncbi:MAG: excinuclease ABC subunit UvrA [Anaerotardibacter sp.]
MQSCISIRGARQHNLKNVDLDIPRDQLVVITGLSGSGKSSLAFDTIYAEGQRRYVESLSSYARQFLGQMGKPDIDSIDGLSPAVSIDQKTTSKNPRSTVGTVTEIYDYLRLLFARIGVPHCPECGREISAQTSDQVADEILSRGAGLKAIVMAPVVIGRKGEFTKLFADLQKEGFSRVRVDGEMIKLSNEPLKLDKKFKHTIEVVIDRISIKEESLSRITEAVELAVKLSEATVLVTYIQPDKTETEEVYSLALACPEHGHSMTELQPRDFSFNAPYGACPECLGLGSKEELDPHLLIPDTSLSIEEGAVVPLKTGNYYPQILRAVLDHYGVSHDTPWCDISKEVRDILLYGAPPSEKIFVNYKTVDGRITGWNITWSGIIAALMERYKESKSETTRQKYQKYFSVSSCQSCHGKRLNPKILAVTVGGKNIHEVCSLCVRDSLSFFKSLTYPKQQAVIVEPIIKEIIARLSFLSNVGLEYLTLDRAAATLSGGEAQRIRLATQIGAGLMGVLYILDEPSIGLHQRDNERLISALKNLRDLGNTVLVVEHDEDTIREADYVIDMGPGAGELGGEVVGEGPVEQLIKCERSITAQYLNGEKCIPVPEVRRNPKKGKITLTGAVENNLKNVSVSIPLGTLTVVTGVSGSGKSSLITATLAPALSNRVNRSLHRVGEFKKLTGDELIDKVIDIDQSPIGRTPRSNPATYVGLWDDIRALFASTSDSKARGYSPGRFSFNVAGGRCEACKGDGQKKIEMHFLPDVYVDCEVCGGKRYNRETLQVKYKGKSVYDVLEMTVDDALEFFNKIPGIKRKLETLHDVGLGYVRLGQPATTLSGGEAQRVKLASELQRKQTGKTFYILDEPTTGLHMDDVAQLLSVLQRLVDAGNTVLVIEHNLDVIKSADYLIDLGPEGGDAGGQIVVKGTPEKVAACEESYTGRFLKKLL